MSIDRKSLLVESSKTCPECKQGILDWHTGWRIYVCRECRTGMGPATYRVLTEENANG